MFWWILILCLIVLGYCLLKKPHSYWKERGVVQTNPVFIFGDLWALVARKQSSPELVQTTYNSSPETRYVGMYNFLRPVLMLRDPELIKQIAVKDFDHFLDHRGVAQHDGDPLMTKLLMALKGQEWKDMRSRMSPAFTGNKMKYMFSLMSQNGQQFVQHFLDKNQEVIEVEMKEVLSKVANDVIGNTVFGFQCDSLKDPNNEFYVLAKEAFDFTSIRKMAVFMMNLFLPLVVKIFKLTIFSDKVTRFFIRIVKENIESREKQGVTRPDMISLLLEARKNNLKHEETPSLPDTGFATAQESEVGKNEKVRRIEITDEDIASQAFIFFLAGFESVSVFMSFMSYELGVNPDIQEKLREEIDKTREKCEGTLTYEIIATMKYMDMVVSETLRKWPTAVATDRICTKPYTIEPKFPDEKPIHLDVDVDISIPMYSIHRDPQYYPDPERFNPERFSEENKEKIVPYTFIPFGVGPRNCIGSRFALMEVKILFFYLLSSFEIVPVEKTQIPIRFNRKTFPMAAEKGFWFGLKRRDK